MTGTQRVKVATCHDESEATLIRSILSAHGIEAVIPGGGASVGVAAAGFRTHVFVDPEDAEEAEALIADLRASPPVGDEWDPEGHGEPEDDAGDAAIVRSDAGLTNQRRTRVGTVVLLGVLVTLGTGHLATGAWKRAMGLAALEIVGFSVMFGGQPLGAALVAAAVLLDVIGGVMRARRLSSVSAQLPVAKVRVSPSRVRP